MAIEKAAAIAPAKGKLGVLLVGLGAVSTTFIAGVEAIKKGTAAAYLSPFHFARLFKKLTGASPHAYLATLRVARAQTLLAETDLNVTEISARVGYGSPSHFTKAFRQATGLTPRAFRNALVAR